MPATSLQEMLDYWKAQLGLHSWDIRVKTEPKGEREEKPVYIGDVEKAKAIHAQGKLNALPDGEGLRHIGAALGNWQRPASRTEQ